MKAALAWIKEVRSAKVLSALHRCYVVKENMIYATDGRMWAAHPFPWPMSEAFCVSGPEFELLIERLPDPIQLYLEEAAVKLRSGRLSGAVKIIADLNDWPMSEPAGERIPLPEKLLEGFRLLRPFISDNASRAFATCIHAANNTLYATNNIAIGAVLEVDLDEINVLIPHWAVDFVLARAEGLTHWSYGTGITGIDSVSFHWDNGAWIRTQLVDATFPPQAETIINECGWAGIEITSEWREAFKIVNDLSERAVMMYADRMTTKHGHMDVVQEIETVVPPEGFSCWDPKYLEPVIAVATHWQPDRYPKPAPFRGGGIIGVAIGRRPDSDEQS